MRIAEFQRERLAKVIERLSKQLAAAKETDEKVWVLKTDVKFLTTINNQIALKCGADSGHNLWRRAALNLKNRKGIEVMYILDDIEWEFLYLHELEFPIEKKSLENRLRYASNMLEVMDEVNRLSLSEKQ